MESDKKYPQLFAEAYAIADRLNELLLRYRLTPSIVAQARGRRRLCSMECNEIVGGCCRADTKALPTKPPEPAMDEPGAIQKMLALSRNGYLDRVRTCVACEQWFYARFSHAKFCSRGCQQRYFRSSEDFKEHKKQYMRALRKLHSERDSRYALKRGGSANVTKKAR